MRHFVVLGHDAPTTPNFSLDDLPGTAGRLDLLARCLTGALLCSHGVRADTRVSLVLADEYTLRVEGNEVRGLHPDERSTAARIRSALERREAAIGHEAVETGPGFSLSRRDFAAVLDGIDDASTVVQLHEDGHPVSELASPSNPVFVLSDHRDFTAADEEALADHVDARVSLGPERLHADQAIAVVHNYLDTEGYTRY